MKGLARILSLIAHRCTCLGVLMACASVPAMAALEVQLDQTQDALQRARALAAIPVPADHIEARVLDLVRQWAPQAARRLSADAQAVPISRIEVAWGAVDGRLRLAACEKVQVYVPDGATLWGRSRVGVRCERGAVRWNVFVPVMVRAIGRGVVPAAPLMAGAKLEVGDLRLAEVDLAADASAAVLAVDAVVGRVLARNVAAGVSLRQDHLRPRRYFSVGDPVRLVVKGSGFAVNGEGQALTPGDEGQCARVRTESGRIVCGQPVGDRLVELLL